MTTSSESSKRTNDDLIAKLSNLGAHSSIANRNKTRQVTTADVPFGSFNPLQTFNRSGEVGVVNELLRLRGLIGPHVEAATAIELLEIFRTPTTIDAMRPRQDWFLGPNNPAPFVFDEDGPDVDLIVGENSANWFAHLVDNPPATTKPSKDTNVSPELVRIFNPEIDVVFGDLPLGDFLLRMAVQELVWIMRPTMWERRRITGASIPAEAAATTPTSLANEDLGLFPTDVAIGPDWIVSYGGYVFETIYLLRYEHPDLEYDERFEQARATLGGDWADKPRTQNER